MCNSDIKIVKTFQSSINYKSEPFDKIDKNNTF